jgi:hypothetical protein
VPLDQIKHLPSKEVASGYVNRRVEMGVWVGEHVLVAEAVLGQRLPAGSSVHHVNKKRNDNRRENLEVWSKSHPGGVRLVCPDCGNPLVAG